MKTSCGIRFPPLLCLSLLLISLPTSAQCSDAAPRQEIPVSWEATYFIKHPVSGSQLGTRTVSVISTDLGWSIREHQVFRYDQEVLEHTILSTYSPPPECRLLSQAVETRLGGTILEPQHALSLPVDPLEPLMISISFLSVLSSSWIPDSGRMDKVTIMGRASGIRGYSRITKECVIIRLRRCRDDRQSIHVMQKGGREIALLLLDEHGRMTHEITEQAIAIRADQEHADLPIPEEMLNIHGRNLKPSKRLPRIF